MKLWSWGANNTGQLGHGYSSEQISKPLQLNNLHCLKNNEDEIISTCPKVMISCGGSHSIISIDAGADTHEFTLYHFGLPLTKFNCPNEQILPKTVSTDAVSLNSTESISSGWDFSLFLNNSGEVFGFGDNSYGQLGISSQIKFSEIWFKVPIPSKIIQIATGMRHAVGITLDKKLFCWGDSSKGQTGLNSSSKIIKEPTLVITEDESSSFVPRLVRCTKMATIILSEDNYFYGAGLNKFGIFGVDETTKIFPKFRKIFKIETDELKIKDFQCGWNHVLVLLEDGRVLSWGRNNFHQLGRRTSSNFDPIPNFVEGLPKSIVEISCGSEHNLVRTESGQAYSWGWNEHDNCGVETGRIQESIEIPILVPIPPSEHIIKVSSGGGACFLVTEPHQSS